MGSVQIPGFLNPLQVELFRSLSLRHNDIITENGRGVNPAHRMNTNYFFLRCSLFRPIISPSFLPSVQTKISEVSNCRKPETCLKQST